jgi:CheY-like chemotaxis protein
MVKMPLAAVSGDEYLAKGRSEDSRESSHSMIGVLELSGLRVLVVDDEADARDLISIILTQSGAEVKAVASAAEALRELTEWRPDALVSDIGMPGEDGYTLIRRLRAMEAQLGGRRMIPAIALTAYARGQERLQALAAGYQAHLSKPAKLTDLVLTIKDLTRPIDQS